MSASVAEMAAERLQRKQADRPLAAPLILDAARLLMTKPQPVRAIVPNWLYEGLGLLVSNPKVGKSTLILQIAVAAATGGEMWGEKVPRAKVLMIDLETNDRRLRRKLEQAAAIGIEPGWLLYSTQWPRGLPGVDAIANTVDADPQIKLVVIDTLQRFRDAAGGRQNAYAADYEALAPLQQVCKERPGLAIVCVHHKRKTAGDDPIDSINGSAAIAGACDWLWFMGRKGSEFSLHVQGRDWERDEDTFVIERDGGQWRLLDAPRFTANEAEVLRHLDIAGGMTGPQLGEALQVSRQAALDRLTRMRDRGLVTYREGAWRAV